jgi:hypothetical protein
MCGTSVSNPDMDEEEYHLDYFCRTIPQPLIYEYDPDRFAQFVNRLVTKRIGTPTSPHFETPRSLFLCSTLMSLKLWLCRDISAITPSSNCFPCLKFLHVTLSYPDSDSMETGIIYTCSYLTHLV